jgi:hypothetical protein
VGKSAAAEELHAVQQNLIKAMNSVSSLNDALDAAQENLILAKWAVSDKRCAADDANVNHGLMMPL